MATEKTVHGISVDEKTRCEHYHSPLDIIAIKFKCCGKYYACIHCHESLAGHDSQVWNTTELDLVAILCGQCKNELTINEYLACNYECPYCKSAFNPKCSNHNHFYFEE